MKGNGVVQVLNLAITTLFFALGSGTEAFKARMQHGVYFRETRIGRQLILLFFIGLMLLTFPETMAAQIFIGVMVLLMLLDWILPFDRATIHIRNGSHQEAREELEKVLQEEGYTYEVDVNEDSHYVYRIPALGKTKLTLKETGTFIQEDYSERAELAALYTGYGNPVKETVEVYIGRMRELRYDRSFHRTWLLFGALSLIMLIITAVLFYQAWQSPWEYPNQRIDELFN
ncbi:hypothetical protein BBEV_2904 [Salisediminibacterium beveridgei]|uniref:Uncharacterized protein n=1 Tax=Salisediminibacterium beveridgei TaxID=632773 RepID=A0A1D7QYZ8_9BACI|nr:hypothetical protein BBEV_2904 [Salisediminibacterium beveridgei]